LGKF